MPFLPVALGIALKAKYDKIANTVLKKKMFSAGNTKEDEGPGKTAPYMQTPYLSIDPNYLGGAGEYILPEDASAVRSRVQTMFSIIGTATVFGAGIGGFESLRYSGLQLLKGKSQRMQMTSAVLKNGGQMAQKFGAVAFLYCACSIVTEKIRGVEDDLNTLVGGTTAGALYSLPGVLNVKKHGPQAAEEEAVGILRKTVRRLPPVGRFFFGAGAGLAFGGLLCLYRSQASDYIQEITRKS
uniref:Mitochondrial import inner membrane translocase subunit Tim23 n=1 Tax=Phallusia mammillata TaxID=59560 RepID=A0A6F9DVC0_9ASCI|nr:mitochondrial import inner membrane translocase subunit Tim23 [Phallusia mammillata]